MEFQGASSSSNQIFRQIEIMDCDITNNTALGSGDPASLLISSEYSPFSHKVVITNVSIRCHRNEYAPSGGSVMLVANMNAVWFINCSFYNNNLTALIALESQLTFHGNNTFVNNRGVRGGALALYKSDMYLDNNTLLVFKDNKARLQGGGIFVAKKISIANLYPCFVQILTHVNYASLSQFNIHIVMENNTAPYGSALFGGLVDFCWSKSSLADDKKVPLTYPEGKWIFDSLFEIKPSEANDTSVISSDALYVCFCENDLVQCGVRTKNVTAYPGGTLNTSAVTVGQRNGTVPGSIAFSSNGSYLVPHATWSSDYYTQCKYLKQQIFSQEKLVTVNFLVTSPIFIGLHLLVSFLDCPPGFILTPNGSCDCVPVLKHSRITCNIDDQTVHRIAPLWIGYQPPAELDAHSNTTAQDYSNSSEVDGTIVHKHCPLDYCKTEDVDMWLNDTDQQCAHHHSGVLCGGCKPGFSIAFGSSRCLTCTSSYLALVLVFAGAGVALVALLMLCDLTVSKGTLNGLIFYANVVQVNSSIFFPNTRNQILSIFIAWLNLDLGIETCFYDGMDMYAKAWLQFVFPLYIWFLVIAIIVSSNYSITAAKLAGRNGPKVLSTLLLLSDARILRAVITTFSYTSLSVPSDYRETLVWLYDGNINYLSGKHIPLFIAGLLFTVLFLIPYTLAACLIQYLQRHSGSRLLCWMHRIKPLLKAYTFPYKDKYRFWTGLLLLVRVVLFLATAVNTLGDPSLNLLLIIVTANCLLALEWILRGIYKEWPLDILEASSLLNLSILSAATLYIRSAGGNQVAITSTSTGIALATFVGILIHHTYNSITTSTYWRRLVAHLKRHSKTHNTMSRELEPLATGTGSSSSDSDSEYPRMEPHARIQPLRLTFDTNNEPILVAASGDHARVQTQTIDQDEECILVVEDNQAAKL